MAEGFTRHVKEELIKELVKTGIWKEKLKEECKNGEVFLALRKDFISFYHKGGRLFTFDGNEFATNMKYASVIVAKNGDLKEKQLAETTVIKNFLEGYDRIKENCRHYAEEQKKGSSHLWHNSSYLTKEPSVILDVEIALKDENGKEIIDTLIYNKSKQTLRFVETKIFSNKDLWSTTIPKTVKQINAYKESIKANKKKIIDEYGRYIINLNQIFKTKLKTPTVLDDRVALTIYGFDTAQNDKRFTNLVKKNPAYADIPIYCKGDPNVDFLVRNIWKKTC